VAERPVLPRKPGNAGGGKGPQLKTNEGSGKDPGLDGQDFADIEAYGLERWLGELT
jgi:hypothetical protein